LAQVRYASGVGVVPKRVYITRVWESSLYARDCDTTQLSIITILLASRRLPPPDASLPIRTDILTLFDPMPLKGSSFLCLLPYRTRALIDGHSLALHLPRDCIYVVRRALVDSRYPHPLTCEPKYSQPWVHALQAYISNLNSNFAHPWGVYSPADILLDDRSCSLSSPASANIIRYDYGDCKLKSRVLRGLGALTTACLLYDMIVWMEGGKDLQCRVLQHARQDIVVGDWPVRRISSSDCFLACTKLSVCDRFSRSCGICLN
jgi:hypothetical protein